MATDTREQEKPPYPSRVEPWPVASAELVRLDFDHIGPGGLLPQLEAAVEHLRQAITLGDEVQAIQVWYTGDVADLSQRAHLSVLVRAGAPAASCWVTRDGDG